MYEMALKFRSLLRWLAAGAASLLLVAALLAAALPFLIEGPAVRANLTQSLSAWSGGPVKLEGRLRTDLASLSVEASGVRFPSTPRLAPIQRFEAKSVTAILKVSSLLRGRLEFKTIRVEAPKFIVDRVASHPEVAVFGLETARMAAGFLERNPFEHLELRDCTFALADTGHRAYKRLAATEIRLDKAAPAGGVLPLTSFYLSDGLFEASFRGRLDGAGETASGTVRLKLPPGHPLLAKATRSIAPWEQSKSMSFTGDLTWSGKRLSLDRADISFGDRRANGSLALALRHGRALLEGTLAYDKLDWTRADPENSEESDGGQDALHALMLATADAERSMDLDVRISAERFSTGPYESGPLALAITSRSGHSSIDIAELALFGGRITGRLDYDSTRAAPLTLNASGTRLDSAALASALELPVSVSGPASVRMALEIPVGTKPLVEEMRSATGSFAVEFPSGGALDGNVSQRLSAVLEQQDSLWGLGSSSFQFTAASIDGTAGVSGVSLSIEGEHAGNRIGGTLRIASPGNAVSGTLFMSEVAEAGDSSSASVARLAPPAHFNLSGTLAALNISSPGKPNLSN
jgi:hypothetical protein